MTGISPCTERGATVSSRRLPRGPGRSSQPGASYPGSSSTDFVAERAGHPCRVRRIGQPLDGAVGGRDLEQVLHPVDVGAVDRQDPAGAVVTEVEEVPGDPDLLVEPDRAQCAVRVVEAERHGPLVDDRPLQGRLDWHPDTLGAGELRESATCRRVGDELRQPCARGSPARLALTTHHTACLRYDGAWASKNSQAPGVARNTASCSAESAAASRCSCE